MKVATFNINNINRRLPNLLRWLSTAKPDVVCLQELKASRRGVSRFPRSKRPATARCGAARKPGTASPSSRAKAEPVLIRDRLPGDAEDTQARYIEAAVNGILVACIYLPNGNPQPGPKFDYKLAWFERLDRACRRAAMQPARPWCSPATTTSCRPKRTSIRPVV